MDLMREVCDRIYKRSTGHPKADLQHKERVFRYFHYQNDCSRARANVLTFLERPGSMVAVKNGDLRTSKQVREELFYLQNCYRNDYPFIDDPEVTNGEIHHHSGNAIWGISTEASACLTYPDMESFIRDVYYDKLHDQYLFMYILLLHQKYTLYMFLRNLGDKEHEEDIDSLSRYRDRLYEFESEYVFSCITEVNQYQSLYDRIYRVLRLDDMYRDVREPLNMLNRLQKEKEEKKQGKQERRLTEAMLILSVLVVFSAFADSFDWAGDILRLFGASNTVVVVVRIGLMVLIFYVLGRVLWQFHDSKKEDRKS